MTRRADLKLGTPESAFGDALNNTREGLFLYAM
jgi:hypothetical protein